jgi:putative FmdB family regulatory protein
MPIYEYRCAACGHQEDHLQKVSEAPLTKCPACGKKKYEKQLSAAGFQLKGSGWYVTDFRGDKSGKKPEAKTEAKGEAKPDAKTDAKTETKSEAKPESKPDTKAAKKATAGTTN